MKKTDIILILFTLVFTLLCYGQSPGINYLIVNLAIIIILLVQDIKLLGKGKFISIMVATILAGWNVVWINTQLSIIIHWFSVITLIGISIHTRSSLLIATVNATYSLIAAAIIKTVEKFDRAFYGPDANPKKNHLTWLGFISVFIPLLISVIFFKLYASANPAIEHLVADINLDFISWGWVKFYFVSFLVILGVFYPIQINGLIKTDDLASNVLHHPKTSPTIAGTGSLKYELKAGILMLFLLNVLIFGFHIVDVYFLKINPQAIPGHANYLHQGVNTLIISVILAIAVILFYFRGNLNFLQNNRGLKFLAYLWVFQNILLVTSTGYKNFQYILDFGLTYKRIGVFVYLLLTIIGLITTIIKIGWIKNSWFLFRVNGAMFYLVFLGLTFINWDVLITRYNLKNTREVDIEYLIKLSDKNLPQLLEYRQKHPSHFGETEKTLLDNKYRDFIIKIEAIQWPSWNIQNQQVYHKITE